MCGKLLNRLISASIAAVTLFTAVGNSWGIVRLDDGDNDWKYTWQANNVFTFGGQLICGNSTGSATLISPNWIITAGHAAFSSPGEVNWFTSANGTIRAGDKVVYNGTYDIALIHLNNPIPTSEVKPVKLYSLQYGSEINRNGAIEGAGMSGVGSYGESEGVGTLRAAYTWVRGYADQFGYDYDKNALLTYFRTQAEGAYYLEGTGAHGDSGGGLFLQVDGQWTLAGVQYASQYGSNGIIGSYDSGSFYTRTGTLLDWILTNATDAVVIPEPGTLSLMVISAAIILKHGKYVN